MSLEAKLKIYGSMEYLNIHHKPNKKKNLNNTF